MSWQGLTRENIQQILKVRKSIKNGSDAGNILPAGESCSIGNSKLVAIVTAQRVVKFLQGQLFKNNCLVLHRSLVTHISSTCLQEK
jgi:hypothetical protein